VAVGVCGGMFSSPMHVREKVYFRAGSKKHFSRVREGRRETYPHILRLITTYCMTEGCKWCIAGKTYTRLHRYARRNML